MGRHVRNQPVFTEAEQTQVINSSSLLVDNRGQLMSVAFQLCGRFSLSDVQLRTVLEALSYIFEQVRNYGAFAFLATNLLFDKFNQL